MKKCAVNAQVLFVKGNCDEDSDDPLDRIVSIDGCRIYMTAWSPNEYWMVLKGHFILFVAPRKETRQTS